MSLQQTIPLTDAFTDQYINVPGKWLASDSKSNGYIICKFDDTSYGEVRLNPGDVYKIPFDRFWVSNPGQAGRKADIIIGFGDEEAPISSGSTQTGIEPAIGTSVFEWSVDDDGFYSDFIIPVNTNIRGVLIHSIITNLKSGTVLAGQTCLLTITPVTLNPNYLSIIDKTIAAIGEDFTLMIQNEAIIPNRGLHLNLNAPDTANGGRADFLMRYSILT